MTQQNIYLEDIFVKMLARWSVITKRGFSKDLLASRWKRSDPNRYWRVQ